MLTIIADHSFSPDLKKNRSKTLGNDHSFSPDLRRNRSKTLGNDSCFLSIPFNTPPTPHRGRHQTFIGEIDVSTYSDDECGRNPSPLPLPVFPQFNDIASFQCVFQFIRDENTVLVELRDLRTDFKPFSYKGARIKQRYIVKLEIHCVDSPKPFRNSLKRRESTPYVELLLGKPTEIQLKHKPTDKTTMRLRLYEATRQNRHLTCGYVNVSVNDVIKCSETCYLVNETFQLCSESSGKARGSVSGSIQWDEKFHSVHVKIHSVTREKVSKKENLVQLTAYIKDREIDHHTTHTVCSPNIDVKFREKLSFIIPKHHQGDSKITDLSLTIQLCEHGVLSTTHQGKAVVGPNMYTDGETCWQKALNYPGHDVDFQLPLYL